MDEKDFLNLRDSIQNVLTEMLLKVDDKEFVKFEKQDLYYSNLVAIGRYGTYHSYFSKKPSFQPSGDLMKRFEGIDYTNTKDYNNYADYKVRLFQIDF